MNVQEFKKIYLLEFYHRQLGKALGFVFVLPLLYFSIRGYLRRRIYYNLLGLLAFGSLQGFLGWWMVKSGLKESLGKNYNKKDVKVAPYRLAVHFTTAVVLFGALLNTSLFLIRLHPALKRSIIEYKSLRISRHACFVALFWNFCTLVTGSLMAGSYAGKICNTFPKMGDIWFPGRFHLTNQRHIQYFKDFFENQFIIHFNHRLIATLNIGALLWNFNRLIGMGVMSKSVARTYFSLIILSISQYCLGIMNVYSGCRIDFAHTHQFLGITTFSTCILAISLTRKANAKQIQTILSHLITKDRLKLESQLKLFKTESPKYYNMYFQKSAEQLKISI